MQSKQRKSKQSKKTYAKPRLVRYGDVRALTQTGTLTGQEMTSAMSMASSVAYKENLMRVGEHPLGFGLYLFDYRPEYRQQHGSGRQFGVLAEEVEKVVPQAVSRDADGSVVVDYAALGISRPG